MIRPLQRGKTCKLLKTIRVVRLYKTVIGVVKETKKKGKKGKHCALLKIGLIYAKYILNKYALRN